MRYIDKSYGNRSVHIGLVARCNKNELFGLLYGFRKAPYKGREYIIENKLFYFEKDINLEIPNKTFVTYLSVDYNGFSPKADLVYPLSSIVMHRDERGICRADGVYHDDEAWRLINEGIPYFDYERCRSYCICYSIIENDNCIIYEGLFGAGIYMKREAEILEMREELKSLQYSGWPTLEDVTNKVIEFKKHIDSIKVNTIIDKYEIKKVTKYYSRPRKDDQYFEILDKCLPFQDKYLSYLLPTEQEELFYDDNAYRSEGYRDSVTLLEEETLEARKKAKETYSKEKHLAFLINDYFSDILKKKERSETLNQIIFNEFDISKASKVVSNFNGELTDEFIVLLNEYNESTIIGSLVK